jgi:hypothetical protein
VSYEPLTLTEGGFLCGGGTGRALTMSMKGVNGTPGVWISSQTEDVLCAKAESVCPQAAILPAGTWLTTGVPGQPNGFTVAVNGTETQLSCEWATIGAKTQAAGGNPLPAETWTSLQESTCRGLGGLTVCASSSMNAPPASIEATGGGGGVIEVGSGANPLTISDTCGGVHCKYSAAGPVQLDVRSSGEAIVSYEPLTLTEGGFLCGGGTGRALTMSMKGVNGTPGVWISNY